MSISGHHFICKNDYFDIRNYGRLLKKDLLSRSNVVYCIFVTLSHITEPHQDGCMVISRSRGLLGRKMYTPARTCRGTPTLIGTKFLSPYPYFSGTLLESPILSGPDTFQKGTLAVPVEEVAPPPRKQVQYLCQIQLLQVN